MLRRLTSFASPIRIGEVGNWWLAPAIHIAGVGDGGWRPPHRNATLPKVGECGWTPPRSKKGSIRQEMYSTSPNHNTFRVLDPPINKEERMS
jgi:hypothetical protein